MESLGKVLDLDGKLVNQGISVLGNKDSTEDQHSYIQQLKSGLNNFFMTFIKAPKDQPGEPLFLRNLTPLPKISCKVFSLEFSHI